MPRRRTLPLAWALPLLPAVLWSFGLPAPARGESAVGLSGVGVLDTEAPRLTLVAPEPGAVLIGGDAVEIRWSLADRHLPALPAEAHPLQIAFRIDGLLVHADSLSLAEGSGEPPVFAYVWTVPETPTFDCRWTLGLLDAFGNPGTAESEPHRISTQDSPAGELAPALLTLAPNWPNPFNPSTRLRFGLPRAGWARLSIHDVRGRELARLWDGPREAGWLELEWRPRGLASGVYFARLRVGETELARKLVLLK